jgi:hypothetical protein
MHLFDIVRHDDTLIIHRILSAKTDFSFRRGLCGAISKPDAILRCVGLIANAASATQHHVKRDAKPICPQDFLSNYRAR